jgi:hypothetical protein
MYYVDMSSMVPIPIDMTYLASTVSSRRYAIDVKHASPLNCEIIMSGVSKVKNQTSDWILS